MNKNIYILILILAVVISFIGCERELDSPPIKKIDKSKIINIKDIYKIYADSGDNYMFREAYMVYATVIMDDENGNIYKECYIQDSTAGVNLYRLGSAGVTKAGDYVRINLNRAIIKYYAGKLEILFDSVADFKKQIVVLKTNTPIVPAEVTVSDILSGSYDCELVKINDVQFVTTDLYYATPGATGFTNRDLEDCSNQKIYLRTSNLADFAGKKLAQGKGSIVGVITKYVNPGTLQVSWQLLARDLDEINMNGERCTSSN